MTRGRTKLGALAFAAVVVASVVGAPVTAGSDAGGAANAALAQDTQTQDAQAAAEAGAEAGIQLAEERGANVTAAQREAAVEGAVAAATPRADRNASLIRAAARGATHGTLIQGQRANVSQVQATVRGATAGTLQQQAATVVQVQSAAYGASHGVVAGSGNATTDQLRRVANGSAAGATAMAVGQDTENVSMVAEAGQGAAYGALAAARNATVVQQQEIEAEQEQADGDQRQVVTVRQLRAAAFGAAEGAADENGTADAKQIRAAATGAAHGALVQSQAATVEQVQAAARGACRGALTQRQRVSVTQIQEAAYGAAKGSVSQSQTATVEQIQSAAQGGASGVVQTQTVNVVQVQRAASGAASGAARTAAQEQVVDVRQIQAAAKGAGRGSIVQVQVINVVQIQIIAAGASSGAVAQSQVANVVQIQAAARGAANGATTLTQRQDVTVEQLQVVTARSAGEAAEAAAADEVTDPSRIADTANDSVQQAVETSDAENGTAEDGDQPTPSATLSVADQTGNGTALAVDRVTTTVPAVVEVTADGETLAETEVDANGTLAGTLTLDPPLEENATVRVVVVDAATDEPLNVTTVSYGVTTPDPAPETASVAFENQTSNGTSVVVNATNSSNGTFVAIHGTTATGAVGDVIGVSEFVDAGEAENVTVDLFDVPGLETARTALTENATLVAMAHRDTDGDREFDFLASDGDDDGPYLNGTGDPVVDDAFVTVAAEDGNATNGTAEADDGLADTTEPTGNGTDSEGNDTANATGDATNDTEAPANATDGPVNGTEESANNTGDGNGAASSVETVDQTGNGTVLTVDEATAGAEFYVTASANGAVLNRTGTFDAGEPFSGGLTLDPVVGENTTVRVAVVDAATNETVNATTVSYTAAVTPETVDALASYADVEVARDDGYVGTNAFDVADAGAVGIRFVNADLLDDAPDPRTPAILLYTIDSDTGEYELLGAEWYAPASGAAERPSLFDEAFDGPFGAHSVDLASHYGLYAWLFADNPAGRFAQRNPAVETPDLVTVANQTGDGSAVTVDRTVFAEPYSIEVRDETGDPIGRSDTLIGEATNQSVELTEPLTERSSVTVTLIDADTGAEIATPVVRETVQYTVGAVAGNETGAPEPTTPGVATTTAPEGQNDTENPPAGSGITTDGQAGNTAGTNATNGTAEP